MDEIIACPCGFKAAKSQFHKTSGFCPVCGTLIIDGLEALHAKPKKNKEELNALAARSRK